MADILFICTGCAKHLAVDQAGVGVIIACTTCGQKVLVPNASIFFSCSHCHAELAAPPGLAGEEFNCPSCEGVLVVPMQEEDESSSVSEDPPETVNEQNRPDAPQVCSSCGQETARGAVVCTACGAYLLTGGTVHRKYKPVTRATSLEEELRGSA
ncbi:MAG: hypothetical protein PHR35_06810 [Kiritimatiellae bacterium]|nr:hypothetical protein [Kiritimatiellia bacterium]